MQYRVLVVLILMVWVTGCGKSMAPPASSLSDQGAVHRPGSLQEVAEFLAGKVQGTWEIENANRLNGRERDERGNWKWGCIVINNPKNSETGRRIAQTIGTRWSSLQLVVAHGDAFVLISNYDHPEIRKVATLLELTVLTPPQDVRTYVVEHCGLVWKGLRLERPE